MRNQIVRRGNKKLVWELALIALLVCFSARALAVSDPAKLVQSNYWYEDEDIRAVLKSRVGKSAYIAPALPLESKELIIEILLSSIVEAKSKGCALIPVNFGNSHWAALAIKTDKDGRIKAIYNDSLGNASTSIATGILLAGSLAKIDPTIEWIDLQLTQQKDGSSCGAFTAENLITIAELNINNMSIDELRNVLSNVKDAASIRLLHFQSLSNNRKNKLKCVFIGEFLISGECLV